MKILRNIDVLPAAHVWSALESTEIKGVVEERDDAVHGRHDEHADDAPEHMPLPIIVFIAFVERKKVLHQTPCEKKEARRKNHQNGGIDEIGDEILEDLPTVHTHLLRRATHMECT